ncbi:MAG: hypothetical protein DUW69_001746 [Verrucomicrobia bacterium]|jgi:hypothetical protein|nr:MAG: hypothetical protein DUW69_001746 [Verrucomicrobiota bacterium]
MNDTPRKTTVTLEDLLRVKRAEQPPVEFWADFERGMRAKQLAAIVEPRPWWAPFIRVGARIARYQLPVGATAILAITLFTLREYQPVNSNPVFESTVTEMGNHVVPMPVASKLDVALVMPAATSPVVAAAEPAPTAAASGSRTVQPVPSAATAVGAVSHVAMVNAELSSARYMADKMADNLAAAQASDSNLDQMLGHSLRTMDNLPPRSEPLAQISVPGESRLYRLLGGSVQSVSVGSGDSALRLNAQAARHLTERRISESDVISRLAVGGNRLTVKF